MIGKDSSAPPRAEVNPDGWTNEKEVAGGLIDFLRYPTRDDSIEAIFPTKSLQKEQTRRERVKLF